MEKLNYRCHPCHLMKVINTGQNEMLVKGAEKHDQTRKIYRREESEEIIGSDWEDESDEVPPDIDEAAPDFENTNYSPNHDQAISDLCVMLENSFQDNNHVSYQENRNTEKQGNNSTIVNSDRNNIQTRPKGNSHIEFTLQSGKSNRARVLSKQPKRSGKYGSWMNLQIEGDEEPSSLE